MRAAYRHRDAVAQAASRRLLESLHASLPGARRLQRALRLAADAVDCKERPTSPRLSQADLLLPARRHLEPLRASHAVLALENRPGNTQQLSLQRAVVKEPCACRPAVKHYCSNMRRIAVLAVAATAACWRAASAAIGSSLSAAAPAERIVERSPSACLRSALQGPIRSRRTPSPS